MLYITYVIYDISEHQFDIYKNKYTDTMSLYKYSCIIVSFETKMKFHLKYIC